MFLSDIVGDMPVADAARKIGAPFSSLSQWLSSKAIVVDSRVYTRVKRVGGFPQTIPQGWVWFDETWYRPSCAKPLQVVGSALLTVGENLAAGRGPRDVGPACTLSVKQRDALESLGFESWSPALDALLGLA